MPYNIADHRWTSDPLEQLLVQLLMRNQFSATLTATSGNVIDVTQGDVVNLTLGANVGTFTVKGGMPGQTILLSIIQDATGSRTWTMPTVFKFAGASEGSHSSTAAYRDSWQMLCLDGVNWVEVSRSLAIH